MLYIAGHAIAGDSKYGDEDFSKEIRDIGGKRLFLHASDLKVTLPDGEVLAIHASMLSQVKNGKR